MRSEMIGKSLGMYRSAEVQFGNAGTSYESYIDALLF